MRPRARRREREVESGAKLLLCKDGVRFGYRAAPTDFEKELLESESEDNCDVVVGSGRLWVHFSFCMSDINDRT